jgi:hypothetical protein
MTGAVPHGTWGVWAGSWHCGPFGIEISVTEWADRSVLPRLVPFGAFRAAQPVRSVLKNFDYLGRAAILRRYLRGSGAVRDTGSRAGAGSPGWPNCRGWTGRADHRS